jgi:adenylate cyclase
VHHGPVVLGDIGGASRLEFAVLGDTVNVASRLEHATRALDAAIVASDAVVQAARSENEDGTDAVLARFAAGPAQTLPGRAEPVAVWIVRRDDAA